MNKEETLLFIIAGIELAVIIITTFWMIKVNANYTLQIRKIREELKNFDKIQNELHANTSKHISTINIFNRKLNKLEKTVKGITNKLANKDKTKLSGNSSDVK